MRIVSLNGIFFKFGRAALPRQYQDQESPAITFQIAKILTERPTFLALGMSVIAEHSEAESYLSSMMISLLGADPAPGAAIFNAVRNNNLQIKAICDVASVVLIESDFKKLKLSLKSLEASAEFRNTIAHRIWGVDKNIPDCVILAKSNAASNFSMDISYIPQAKNDQDRKTIEDNAVKLMNSKFEIWDVDDFKRALDLACEAKSALQRLWMEISMKGLQRSIETATAFRRVD